MLYISSNHIHKVLSTGHSTSPVRSKHCGQPVSLPNNSIWCAWPLICILMVQGLQFFYISVFRVKFQFYGQIELLRDSFKNPRGNKRTYDISSVISPEYPEHIERDSAPRCHRWHRNNRDFDVNSGWEQTAIFNYGREIFLCSFLDCTNVDDCFKLSVGMSLCFERFIPQESSTISTTRNVALILVKCQETLTCTPLTPFCAT